MKILYDQSWPVTNIFKQSYCPKHGLVAKNPSCDIWVPFSTNISISRDNQGQIKHFVKTNSTNLFNHSEVNVLPIFMSQVHHLIKDTLKYRETHQLANYFYLPVPEAQSTENSQLADESPCKGCFKRLTQGCVKVRWKSCVLLPAEGKQNATFSPNFTQPWAHL